MKTLSEKIILITGSTDGIGKLTALSLAKQMAKIIIHGRDKEKVNLVINELKNSTGNQNINGFTADFSSLKEVRKFANEVLTKYSGIDVLINNAGVGFADERYSNDGYELRFAVNYLAPFLLTRLLLPALKNNAPSRIINVSSIGQHPIDFDDIMLEKNFDSFKVYRQSKLAFIMFTIDLAEELKNENITVNSLHPGTLLNTNMVRRSNINPMGEPETGADAEVFLATSEKVSKITSKYFSVKTEASPHIQAFDKNVRERLRKISLELTELNK